MIHFCLLQIKVYTSLAACHERDFFLEILVKQLLALHC